MNDQNWDDLRVALAVARAGTVSAAATALGVHHATVIRRIDALESRLGARLFQRHARGYALTEAGRAMMDAADTAEDGFARMAAQIAGAGERIEGALVVTGLPEFGGIVMPRLLRLLGRHPDLRLHYLTDERLFRLDTGEAHVAIRAGAQPTQPDYVIRPMAVVPHRLYAAQAYLDAHGPVRDVEGHRFALPGPEAARAPVMRWLSARVPDEGRVLVSNDAEAREAAIRSGLAIGVLPDSRASGLVEVMCLPEWSSHLWLVSHVDLHRTPKVQAALRALREAEPGAADAPPEKRAPA